MPIGNNIKALRKKAGLTQQELADKLNVTYQAVSRWERDDVEPSIETLSSMTKVLDCTLDELFGNEVVEKEEKEVPFKQVLTICEKCNKPLYSSEEIYRFNTKHSARYGRHHHSESVGHVYCESCYKAKLAEEKRIAQAQAQEHREELKGKRSKSFFWSTIVLMALVIVSVVLFVKGNTGLGICFAVSSVLAFTFINCIIMGNTFIGDLWLNVASWGCVKMPGIIFTFDFDGFKFLIAMKIILGIIGFLIGLAAITLATVLAMVLSIFAFPFAVVRLNNEINSGSDGTSKKNNNNVMEEEIEEQPEEKPIHIDLNIGQWTCPKCGEENDNDLPFCKKCGKDKPKK